MLRKDHLLYKNNKEFKGVRDIIEFLAEYCLQLCVPVSRPSVSNDHSYTSINNQKDSEEGDHRYFIEDEPSLFVTQKSQVTKKRAITIHTLFFTAISAKKCIIETSQNIKKLVVTRNLSTVKNVVFQQNHLQE